jgi:hypothetical protein
MVSLPIGLLKDIMSPRLRLANEVLPAPPTLWIKTILLPLMVGTILPVAAAPKKEMPSTSITTKKTSLKVMIPLRDPRVSLCVDDQTPPFSFVVIEGLAEINQEPDLDELLKWTTKIAARYMGQDNAESYGKRSAVIGEMLVKIRPTKTIAQKDMVG